MQRQVEALPQLRTLAAENIRLAEELRSRTKPIEAAEHDLKLSTDLVEKLSEQFGKTREKATAVGLTETIGQLLRKQRDKLHDPADFQHSVDDRSQAIDDVQFRLYELDEIRSNVANPEIFQSLMAEAPLPVDASIAEEPGKSRPRSSRQQAAASRPAQPQPDQLLRHAAGAGHHQRRLIQLINAYAQYIDERVLWIRSNRPLSVHELYSGKPIRWFLRWKNWKQVAGVLASDVESNPLGPIGLTLLIVVFLYTRRRFHLEIGKLGLECAPLELHPVRAHVPRFLLTLFTSGLGAAIGWYVGWRLGAAAYSIDFPSAVADGLIAATLLFFPWTSFAGRAVPMASPPPILDGRKTSCGRWPPMPAG